MHDKRLNDFIKLFRDRGVDVLINEPLRKHTSFKVGGPADLMILPKNEVDIIDICNFSTNMDIPLTVLGNCSNVLVKDRGIRGIVMKLSEKMSCYLVNDELLTVSSGFLLSYVAKKASEQNLSGLEFAAGIPGSVGGGVFMNAGAYDSELKDIVFSVKALDFNGQRYEYKNDELDFGYRKSVFLDNKQIITSVSFKLKKGNKNDIIALMRELNTKRRLKQPLEFPSAGSTFKRPPGKFAGQLIEDAGLKGFSVGGAAISKKHAGFIINTGNATAKDIISLIEETQKKIYSLYKIEIYPEVKIMGE